MSENYQTIDHDDWNNSPPKSPKSSKIVLGEINGVIPYGDSRNPLGRSATSHRIVFPYRTAANDMKPKVGIFESAAEAGGAHEALISKDLYDLECQPLQVHFLGENRKPRQYTHDIRLTMRSGHRRFLFIRNGASLQRRETWAEIEAIQRATPANEADDLYIVNADDYPRQRRENLFRMHNFVFQPDDEADEIVTWTARRARGLWLVKDLYEPAGILPQRTFRAVYRLVARQVLLTDLNSVLWENSRIELAS